MNWNLNWNALAAPDIGTTIRDGFESGQRSRAMSQFDINNPDSVNALLRVDPRAGAQMLQIGQRQRENEAEQGKQAAAEKAARAKVLANAAKAAKDPASWDAIVDALVLNGYAEAADAKGKFSPENRIAVMAAGGVEDDAPKPTALQQNYEYLQQKNTQLAEQYLQNEANPYKWITSESEDGSKTMFPVRGGGQPAGSTDAVWQSLIQQESGGRPGVTGPDTPYGNAQGMTQMLPQTAQAMAGKVGLPWQPQMMTDTSPAGAEYQTTLGRAYFEEGLQKYGGDVRKALMYYHGGPNERLWGPKTRAYADQVLARAGGGQGAAGGIQIAPPKPPKEKDAPSGFRWKGDGSLEPIPGGPGDPNNKGGGDRKAEADLRKEFNQLPEIKDFKDVRASFTQIKAIGQKRDPSAQDDIAMIFSYMKMLDPGSVVREGEFATAQNAAGVPDQIRNTWNKALSGERLNPRQRQQMVGTAATVYKQRRETYNNRAVEYRSYAGDYGVDPDRIAKRYLPTQKPAAAPVKVSTPEEARALPRGTVFINPQGKRMVR